MDLFENQVNQEKEKTKKLTRMIIIVIVILLIICGAILGLIMYLQANQLKTSLDGAAKDLGKDTFIIEENGKIYISLNDIAKNLGYSYFKGEYGQASEEVTKGYVQSENEVAMFEANSKKIYKTELKNNSSSEYSYFYIDEPIKFINGKLYTTPEGIKIGFNSLFNYDVTKKDISVFTLPYLVQYYTTKIVNYGYQSIEDNFHNQKAITDGMIIAKNENGKLGVVDTKGKEIIGSKYDNIVYDETSGDFFVTIGKKKGLVDNQGKTRITLSYDEIQLLDKDSELYLVTNSNKQGVVNRLGDIIIYLEYDNIGVDASLYAGSQIKNPYLLFDNAIVVKKNNKYSLLDKKGNNILPDNLKELDGIGCIVGTSNNKSANNILTIPDYEAIIIMKDKKYGIVNSTGKELIACGLDSIYSVVSNGKTTYQMEYQGQTLNVEEYLEAHGIKKVNPDIDNTQAADNVNVTSDTNTSNATNNAGNVVSNTTGQNQTNTNTNVNNIFVQ